MSLPRPGALWAVLVLLASCAITPLTNRIAVGQEPFVIGVGEGPDGNTDLFAASAAGGSFVRLTFTRAEERSPRLSPHGSRVAFLRRESEGTITRWTLVALELTSGLERMVPLPPGAGNAERLGWSPDGSTVFLHAAGFFAMDADVAESELRPVPESRVSQADSAVRENLGSPVAGMVVECPGGGSCIAGSAGQVTPLGAGVTEAVRWGADSVGYFTPSGFEVRPLAGGRSRRPNWSGAPQRLRSLTYHPGIQSTLTSGVSGTR